MTAEELRDFVRASRQAQGLEATVTDPAAIERIAVLVKGGHPRVGRRRVRR